MADYKNIPVDIETHEMILAICDAYELGRRAQGAVVRKLVKAEYEKLENGGQAEGEEGESPKFVV